MHTKFHNQEPSKMRFWHILRWRFTRKRVIWPNWIQYDIKPKIIPRVDDAIKITYINHVTFLIQFAGINILTDPIWSKRASPTQLIGPSRIHAPGIVFEELPKIDLVLISHDHYDHLDVATIKMLQHKFKPLFVCGLKVSKYLKRIDTKINYQELNWWQATNFNNLEIIFTPAHHWSSRSLFIKNRTLWGGFIIKHLNSTIYFAGDTAWGQHFAQVAERFAPISIAMLPIGSFSPRWFMQDSHMDPNEALQAHQLLSSKLSIAMHFNCFKDLADDEFDESKDILLKAIENNPQLITSGNFAVPLPGQEYVVDLS